MNSPVLAFSGLLHELQQQVTDLLRLFLLHPWPAPSMRRARHAEIAREIEFCECQFVTIVIDIVHDSAISVRRHVCHPPEQALQFATSQPTGEASNSRLCRPAEEPASEWFGSLMRFQFRTSGIGASCGG